MTQDFTQQERFEVVDPNRVVRTTLMATGCLAVVAAALFWFMAAAALHAFHVAGASWIALLIAVVFLGALIWFRKRQLESGLAQTYVLADDLGLTMR